MKYHYGSGFNLQFTILFVILYLISTSHLPSDVAVSSRSGIYANRKHSVYITKQNKKTNKKPYTMFSSSMHPISSECVTVVKLLMMSK